MNTEITAATAIRAYILHLIILKRVCICPCKVSLCSAAFFQASCSGASACFCLTSAMFFFTASILSSCDALSFIRRRLNPMISSFKNCVFSTGSPSALTRTSSSLVSVLQSSPNLLMRSSSCSRSWNIFASTGLEAFVCSVTILMRRLRCCVCDFWSMKCRFLSVSISLNASWISAETSVICSPNPFVSWLYIASCVMETVSATVSSDLEPLQAEKPT
mmetsp:Transcript_159753/g.291547  ORF Transcript_159753/g.291547 Transcript_159753/m.291547 type:complete len:218 (+) Transcript_159753:121-774(+)